MKLSIVIPTLNEEEFLGRTLSELESRSAVRHEIIVVDGGSRDDTVSLARQEGADLVVREEKGRARQMNAGARAAGGDVLYFLHADTIPPEHFDRRILAAVEKGVPAGCFRLSFDPSNPLLSLYAWFTRFDIDAFRFGDQSLFVTRALYRESGGMREDHLLMEDQEFVRRLKSRARFEILKPPVTTSSRKYRRNGMVRLQLIYFWIWLRYRMGASQEELAGWYRRWVR